MNTHANHVLFALALLLMSKGYYHAFFVRERRDLCQSILRIKSRGGGYRASVPEPNFYLPEISTNGRGSTTETATVGPINSSHTVTAPQDVESAVHLATDYPITTMVPFMQSSHYADESAASLLNVGGLAHQPHPWHAMNYFSSEGLQRQWSVNRGSPCPEFPSDNNFVESVRQQQPQQTVAMMSQPSFLQGINYGAVIPDRSAVPVIGNNYLGTWVSVFQAFMARGNLLQPQSNTSPSSPTMTPPFSSLATDGKREELALSEVGANDEIVCERHHHQQRCDPPEADQSFDAYLAALQFENWDGTVMASDEGNINGNPSREASFPAKSHRND